MAFNPVTGQEEEEQGSFLANIPQMNTPVYDGPGLNLRQNRQAAMQAPIAQPMPQATAEAFGAPSATPTPQSPDETSAVRPTVTPADMVRPPIPTQSFRETKAINTTVKRTKVSDEEKQATQAAAAQFDAQKEIAQRQAEVGKQQAQIDASRAAEEERIAVEKEAARKQVNEAANAEISRRDANAMAEFQRYKSMEPRSFWRDKGTGDKVLAAFAVGLGALGGAMSGRGQNLALQTLESAIEKDYQGQLRSIEKQRDVYQLAQGQAAEARKSKAEQLADLSAGFAGRIEAMQAKYVAMKAKAGVPAAELEGDAIMSALEQKKQDFLRQAAEVNRQEITTNTQRTLVEMDNKAAMGGAAIGADMVIMGPDGKQYAGRTEAEAKELREASKSLDVARGVAEKIKQLNAQRGRMPDQTLDREIQQEISNLLELKKGVLGSLNESDIQRAQKSLGAGIVAGSEGPNKAVDAFVRGMEQNLGAGLKAKALSIDGDGQGYAWSPKQKEFVTGATSAQAPQGTAAPGAAKPSQREIAEAMDWLGKNAGDPRAPAIRAKLQQMLGAR